MIEVQSHTEAAAYAWLAGHTLIQKRRVRPDVEIWSCAWRDQLRELTFIVNAGGPAALGPAQFEQVAREVYATLPEGPQLFIRGEARRVFEDALFCTACLAAAGAESPGSPLADLLLQASARRAAFSKVMAGLPDALPIEAVPLPAHGFRPLAAEAAWIATAAPLSVAALPDPWQVVVKQADGRFLLRHPDHALALATVEAAANGERMIVALAGLTGREALTAFLTHGFRLEEVQKARLRAVARAGRSIPGDSTSALVLPDIASVLTLGLGEGRSRAILELRHPNQRLRLVEVETQDPRYKAALVAFFLDSSGAVTGLRVIEGVDGYEMMRLADLVAPTLPGPEGQKPEATQMEDANAELVRIGESVRAILERMLADPSGIAEVAPRAGDAALVFAPAVAAEAEAAYLSLWAKDPPRIRGRADRVTLTIRVCPAGFFGTPNPLAAQFPPGYQRLAPLLNPSSVWVSWDMDSPGHSQDFDGLVWVSGDPGRWVWFPAPYRVLGG